MLKDRRPNEGRGIGDKDESDDKEVELTKGKTGGIYSSRGSSFLAGSWKFGQNDTAFWRCWLEGFIQVEIPVINSVEHYLLNAAMC